jgi:hypothetical protein
MESLIDYHSPNRTCPGYTSCHRSILWYYESGHESVDVLGGVRGDIECFVDRHSYYLFRHYDVSLFEFLWLAYLQDKKWIKK